MNPLELLFPRKCIFCGRLISHDQKDPWCEDCDAQVELLQAPFSLAADPNHLLTRNEAVLRYTQYTRRAILSLKFRQQAWVSRPLSSLLVTRYQQVYSQTPIGLILPVPLHPSRQRQRGYNQSLLLARPLAKALKIPCSTHLLLRSRDTLPQSSLSSRLERLDNLRDAFVCPHPEQIAGQTILLVDDVTTTGSTLYECGRALHEAGAQAVYTLCVMHGSLEI
ncbi:MAG: ComF family protein [Eubacteriales bacterium]|jgi:competence protein ComFC